jgi:GntR family transcriptional regulator
MIATPCKFWIPDLSSRSGPTCRAIVSSLETAIASGSLRAGDVLPSQRLIADFTGVHVNTVNRAMGEAIRRGLITAKTRRGMTIRLNGVPATLFPAAPSLVRDNLHRAICTFSPVNQADCTECSVPTQ